MWREDFWDYCATKRGNNLHHSGQSSGDRANGIGPGMRGVCVVISRVPKCERAGVPAIAYNLQQIHSANAAR
jgi:hypothetical protein